MEALFCAKMKGKTMLPTAFKKIKELCDLNEIFITYYQMNCILNRLFLSKTS